MLVDESSLRADQLREVLRSNGFQRLKTELADAASKFEERNLRVTDVARQVLAVADLLA